LSIILLNSSSNCILNLFPPNFHSSIGRLSNPQLLLFFACLSTIQIHIYIKCTLCIVRCVGTYQAGVSVNSGVSDASHKSCVHKIKSMEFCRTWQNTDYLV